MHLDQYWHTPVFIAYTSDVRIEFDHAKKIIDEYNRTTSGLLGSYLRVTSWDDVKTDWRRKRGEAFQNFLNRAEIDKCEVFILVGAERCGTQSKGHKQTNFEREVREALKIRKRRDNFTFLPFLKILKSSLDPGVQRVGIEKIRSLLYKNDVVFHSFSNLADFISVFAQELYKTIISRSTQTPKVLALTQFFSLSHSSDSDPDAHKLIISFPSMDKKYMGASQFPDFWKHRLVPNLVFEDYKALQKIEKCLRTIRFRDYQIRSTANIVQNYDRMNRFWICLPRNTKAQEQLHSKYSSISRFRIEEIQCESALYKTPEGKEKVIIWKNKSEEIRIRSPLSIYLGIQRANAGPHAEWNTALRDIVAKDFAVIARFTDRSKNRPPSERFLKDFFLGGIRGLGTWGAAWLLDRRYHVLEPLTKNDENLQILLEVTYRNGRITDVVDVSNNLQVYFDREVSEERVRQIITLHESDHL